MTPSFQLDTHISIYLLWTPHMAKHWIRIDRITVATGQWTESGRGREREKEKQQQHKEWLTGIGYSYKWRNNLVKKALCELGTNQNEILPCMEKKVDRSLITQVHKSSWNKYWDAPLTQHHTANHCFVNKPKSIKNWKKIHSTYDNKYKTIRNNLNKCLVFKLSSLVCFVYVNYEFFILLQWHAFRFE